MAEPFSPSEPLTDLVHAPLAHWARVRGDAVAISHGSSDGSSHLTFAELNAAVQQRSAVLTQSQAPATVLVEDSATTIHQLIEFLAVISSGRCAAMADPDWPAALRETMREQIGLLPSTMSALQATSPFYIGFTSGSTGLPKGFRRHHRSWTESFRICVDTFGPAAASGILSPGRSSHSLFLFGMLLGLWTGAGVVVQEQFSASRALDTLRQGHTPCLIAVPSQLILMIEWAARHAAAPIEATRLIMISGARWARHRTAELQALFPQARIIEFYGASETSFVAWMDADVNAPPQLVGKPFANVEIDIRDASVPDGSGLIFVRSPMLFMDYMGAQTSDMADATAAIRDGDWLSVRDMGHLDAQGRLCLAGRQNRMITTQGKNLFPEEVESVLGAHPGIAKASVQGVADALRGMKVVAVVQLDPACAGELHAAELSAWCRAPLEAYKAPKRYFVCDDWPQTASGKTDHAALALRLQNHLNDKENNLSTPDTPCRLQLLYPLL
ncbi:MAG: AMP-binding protein [Polaromonas sp.]|nr:AMP-binding protein [Polaromonas sp.]